jgi:hypothetical protein
MKNCRKIFLIIFGLYFLVPSMSAQEDLIQNEVYTFVLKDTSAVTGKLLFYLQNMYYTVEAEYDTLYLYQDDIFEITQPKWNSGYKVNAEAYQNGYPFNHFLFAGGYGLKKNRFYYQNMGIVYNQLSYAFTDHVSINAGFIPFFLLDRDILNVYSLNVKISLPYKNGKGAFGAVTTWSNFFPYSDEQFLIHYMVNTFGHLEKNVSIGVGLRQILGSEKTYVPIGFVNTKYRIGKEWFIIMEGMVTTFPETYGGYVFAGARRTKKRFGFDLGLFVLMEEESEFFLYPYFSFSIPFWRGK